jgi:transketolase
MRDVALRKRVLELCYRNRTAHVGSCLTAVDIIDAVYEGRQPEDLFVLSNGHAGIALYAVLEKYLGVDAQALYERHGVHPNIDPANGIVCSTGSLGCGLAIACGLVLADRARKVTCLISDGECAEGLVWEALAFAQTEGLHNLVVIANINGFGAYCSIDDGYLMDRLRAFLPAVRLCFTPAEIPGVCLGMEAHYHVLTDEDYATALRAAS